MTQKNNCIKNLREINSEKLTKDDKKILYETKESIESFIEDIEGEIKLISMMVKSIEKNKKYHVLQRPLHVITILKREELKEWKNILNIIEKMLM